MHRERLHPAWVSTFVIVLLGLLFISDLSTAKGQSAGAILIYDDEINRSWTEFGSARSVDYASTEQVYDGANSIAIDFYNVTGLVALSYEDGGSLPASEYSQIRFWIHGGTGGQTISFSVMEPYYGFDNHKITLPQLTPGWQEITVDLAQFPSLSNIFGIGFQATTNRSTPRFFVDQIELIPNGLVTPTAVPTSTETPSWPSSELKMETIFAEVGGAWQTVFLAQSYASPVIVCTQQYVNNTAPTVIRMNNIESNRFDVMLQNPRGDNAVSSDQLYCLVVEEGAWTLPNGELIEAQRYSSSLTDENNSWQGEQQSYINSYSSPVVLGQVMSTNDPDWSVFWSRGEGRTDPPSGNVLFTGLHVGEDSDTNRLSETVGFIVLESGNGLIDGVAYEAAVGADSVNGFRDAAYAYTLNQPFENSPAGAVVSQVAMDGADGSWAILKGAEALTATTLGVMVDEDQIANNERNHTSEQLAYLVFEAPILIGESDQTPTPTLTAEPTFTAEPTLTSTPSPTQTPTSLPTATETAPPTLTPTLVPTLTATNTPVAPSGLKLETLSTTADGLWTTVSFSQSYSSPVITCSQQYINNSAPSVIRLQNVSGSGFEVKLQNPGDGEVLVSDSLFCLVVEEGAWTLPNGEPIEAQRYTTSRTDRSGSWVGESQTYINSYNAPVVLGQVMSANDPNWSVFWSRGAKRQDPADGVTLYTGLHVGSDPNRERAAETIGFIVMESASDLINGIAYEVKLGADSVGGFRTNPYVYTLDQPFDSTPAGAIVSQAAMDGGDGSWVILKGTDALAADQLGVMVDEDQIKDRERNHTKEQVGYFVFDSQIVFNDSPFPPTPTPTGVPTDTPEPTATATSIPTNTPEPTATATSIPTNTPEPTATATSIPTNTPEPTATATSIPTNTPEPTATATSIPTNTPEPTATATSTPTNTPEPTPTVVADPTWTQRLTTNQPNVTDGYAMAYDSNREVIVLYGGGRAWPYSNETWEFDGISWSQIVTTAQPNAVYGMTLVYDSVQNKLLLFGGSDRADNELNETWEYAGGAWLQVGLTANPPPRTGHAAVFDTTNGRMLIHGGNERKQALSDLWAFDGASWTEVSTTNAPAGRTEHAVIIDENELILYGGRLADGTLSNELAVLDLSTGTWVITSGGDPGGRQKHAAVYWPDREWAVVVGGTASASESYTNLAWTFNGTDWASLADGPQIMQSRPAVAIYDQAQGAVVVYTGTQTWVLK